MNDFAKFLACLLWPRLNPPASASDNRVSTGGTWKKRVELGQRNRQITCRWVFVLCQDSESARNYLHYARPQNELKGTSKRD